MKKLLPIVIILLGGCAQPQQTQINYVTATPQIVYVTATPQPTDAPPTLTPTFNPTLTRMPTSKPDGEGITLVDSGQQLGSAQSWDVALGDLDGDGDLDAFVANAIQGGEYNTVWINDGQGEFTRSDQTPGYGQGVALGDLDADGDLDVVTANWWGEGNSAVWLNDGSGIFTDSGQNLGLALRPSLGDLDGDGDLDIFLAQMDANSVWLNEGSGIFSDTGQRLGTAITAVVGLDDLDDDGDLDALVGGWEEDAKVWLNDGAGAFSAHEQRLSSASVHIHDLALGDVDADGDLDAFMAVASGDPNQVWLNDGIGAFSDTGQQLHSSLAHGISLGDLDGDGDLDALTAHGDPWRGSSGGRVWLNDGTGNFTKSDLELGDQYSSATALGDLDGDGDLDAFIARGDQSSESGGGIPNSIWLNEMVLSAPPEPYVGTILLIFGNRFIHEIYETIRPAFEDAGYEVLVASRSLEPIRAKAVDLEVEVDLLLEDVDVENYEAVVFTCDNDLTFGSARAETDRIAQEATAQGRVLAAICSGPRILAYAAVVTGKTVTGEPSQTCQMLEQAGGGCTGGRVERDGSLITARDRYASRDFAEMILEAIMEQPAAPPPAQAAEPAGDGLIAFYSERDGNAEIYTMNPDGSEPRRLTFNQFDDVAPAWSPEGLQIVFLSNRNDPNPQGCFPECFYQLYLIGPDGSDERKLLETAFSTHHPAWHPSGEKLSFDTEFDLQGDVYVVNTDGSGLQLLIEDGFWADWSPDGSQLIFASKRDSNIDIYIANADGSNQQRLTDDPEMDVFPAWSPDGEKIAFVRVGSSFQNQDILLINPDGSGQVRLTAEGQNVDEDPAWSSDGSQIVFQSDRDGNFEIYTMNADGTDQQRLTNHRAGDYWPTWAAEIPPHDKMKAIPIPSGSFQMGSTDAEIADALDLCREHYHICNQWYYEREGPQHTVSLDSFWIDQTEVSNAQYRLCVEAGVCPEPSTCKKGEPTYADPGKADYPVVCVNWQEAQSYCQWKGSRLPTEAEWEYAFRGGAGSIYPWGNEFVGTHLNYCDAHCSQPHADDRFDDGYPLTAPVGGYPQDASWSGVLDMGGNVAEWVADWYGDFSPGVVTNPLGPSTGTEKILKGCSWFFHPAYCRGALRASVDPDTRFDYLGFRCATSVNPETEEELEMPHASIEVPLGNPPTLNGTHSPSEWEPAAVETFTDGSELLLMRDEDFLYLGIRAKEAGTIAANVFLQRGDEIAILHSSAALGTAIYQKSGESWGQTQDFTWQCRNTSLSDVAQAERTAFLQQEGWVAANGRMGTPNEMEYQIKIPEGDFRLAVVYIKASSPYEKVPWPAGLNDDCILPTPGGVPETFYFSPDQWITLK